MALKWKIYYGCGIYLCVWTAVMACLFGYVLITPGYGVVNAPFTIPVFLCILAIAGSKGLLSLWFIGYLKRGDIFSPNEEKMFRFLYRCTVILATAAALLLASQLPKEAGRLAYLPKIEIAIQSGVILFTACAIFMGATGHGLAAAISKNHYDSLIVFDNDIKQS